MQKMTLQEYLATDLVRGVIDHQVRAQLDADGGVSIYIHPANTDGQTVDYRVTGNRLVQRMAPVAAPADSQLPVEGPRVTPQDVEDAIVSEWYQVVPGTTLTLCVLTLQNGFTVSGESPCISPANFKAEIGREFARIDAARKIWTVLGYALRDTLHSAAAAQG